MGKDINDFNENIGIFQKEDKFLQHAEIIINSELNSLVEMKSEYQSIFNHYSKLLQLTKKLVRMGDNTQKKLIEANELVHDKVNQLTIAESKLKKLAITDTLTGLFNRRGTYQWLDEQEVRYRRNHNPFFIFIIDIDHFKKVNDKLGHNAGDYALKEISSLMKNSLREQDCLGRWGGEEFILILPDTDMKGAHILADKLRRTVEKFSINFENSQIGITISLGGSCYSNNSNIDKCLEEADSALYRSKHNGRNKVEIHGY